MENKLLGASTEIPGFVRTSAASQLSINKPLPTAYALQMMNPPRLGLRPVRGSEPGVQSDRSSLVAYRLPIDLRRIPVTVEADPDPAGLTAGTCRGRDDHR